MQINKKLKLIISSLIAGSFMVFGVINAMETNFNEMKINVKDVKGRNLFVCVNNEIDSKVKLCVPNFVEGAISGFTINLLLYRMTNSVENHQIIENYFNNSKDLKIVIKNSNDEVVYERKLDKYSSYLDENNEYVDLIGIKDIINIDDGIYDLCLFYGEEFLGSFNCVTFDRTI